MMGVKQETTIRFGPPIDEFPGKAGTVSNQFEYFDYEIDGVEAYSSVLSEAAFEVSQLEPGTLRGHHTRLRLAEFEISWVKMNLTLRGRGNLPSDTWTISLVLNTDGRSLQHGVEVEAGSMVVHGPGAVHDGIYGRGCSVVCFGVPAAIFEQRVNQEFPDLRDMLSKPWDIFSVSELKTSELISSFQDAVELLRSDESVRSSEAAMKSMVDELLYDYLLSLLEANQVAAHDQVAGAAKIVQKAEKSANDSPNGAPAVGDLCQAVGVSRRTLSRAFQQTVGMGPATYLRRMRLGAARSSILQSNGDGKTISEIAINHGFWHFGRFAEQYREMFGESPRETKSRYLLGQAD